MSAVQAPALILVTGGTGFVGSAIIVNLLQKGFAVRAAVRSQSKTALFTERLREYIDSGDLTFVIVPDMTAPNAFKDAVQGVDGIIHSASPMPPADPSVDPKEILGPAMGMNLRILEAAAVTPTIKRVILTSSAITLLEPHEGAYIYTENDWFDSAPEIVEQVGAKATGPLKYIASKVLAERAAWVWVKENNPSFELVAVLPPWVWGRDLFSNPETIRPTASNARLLKALSDAKSGTMKEEDYFTLTEFTDLLDVAEGHVRALVTPAAAGERIALRGGHVTWQDIFDFVNNNQIPGVTAPIGNPGAGKTFSPEKYFIAEKAREILGMTYRPQKDTLRDTIRGGVELGWRQE